MRILMVSIYPPQRDGIAQYAIQEVRALRAEGHEVDVCSPEPSAAHMHLDLRSRRGPYALARRVAGYDRVIVQWHPAIFYNVPVTPAERRRVAFGLLFAFRRAASVEVRVHEFDIAGAHDGSIASRLTRTLWRSVDRITVHTEGERHDFAEAYELPESRIDVVEHGATFVRRANATRHEARAELGLPPEAFVFLSIGFLQPHKGFDRAVRAFRGLDTAGCRLEVVGSLRLEDPEYVQYVDELRALVDATPGVALHEHYVSDEEFDLWLVACDVVVLPYRMIWSSGVCARAELYGRRVIATRVGGLEHQVVDGTVLVDGDAELAAAMRAAAGREVATAEAWPTGADRAAIQAEVRRRAATRRPPGTPARAEDPAEPLRHLPRLELPPPVSVHTGVTTLKRVVRKLTRWQLDPIVEQVNDLARAAAGAHPADPSGTGSPAPAERPEP
ncbi:MAG: glycosyltransferase family 4 protein [Actinobacteria bacterium]|nr:glycosyltransferase family 4 protein [Actinomycetota bacterium]